MLRVPMTTTFEKLHDAIQTAFDWNNAHAYEFDVHTVANRLKRRTFLDPSYVMNLKNHQYQDYETNMFPPAPPGMAEEERARMPREPEKKAVENTMLMDVLERPEWKELGVVIKYRYDFGDNWDHTIQVLGTADGMLGASGVAAEATGPKIPDKQDIFCFGGEGHPCCEDCGGVFGWEEIKASAIRVLMSMCDCSLC